MKIEGYLSDIEFYSNVHDPLTRYAEFEVPSLGDDGIAHKMFVDMEDEKLFSYIRFFILPEVSEKTSALGLLQAAKDLINLYGNPDTVSPRIRTAGKLCEGLIEYDLNTPSHEYVRVTADGWRVVKKTKHKFLKRNTQGAQVLPVETDENLLSLMKPYINANRDGQILFTAWMVQAFCKGNHHCMLVMAPAGCGKTCLTKIARRVIDNSSLQATMMPDNKDALFAALSNSYFVAWDNSEVLSQEISDILCVAVTGGTIAKRKLYTTNELGVYELHNTILLNGVDIIPSFSDFASRCLLLNLKSLEGKRRPDEEIEKAFEEDLPKIMGAIFSTLSKAMKIVKTLKPLKLPRMLSAYIEMLAIAIALGISESEFERIYFDNLDLIDKERADVAIVEAVREYMFSPSMTSRSIEGRVSEVKEKIYARYSGSTKDLPKSASQFSRKLRQELKTFEAAGLTVNIDNTHADGTHVKIIREI